jgi:phospholipid N-methyltransferase
MKISPEVQIVLSTVKCVGNQAVIVDQLDRKLYTKVNEVLTALGGKWERKAKAHVFDGDAAERIDQAILMGEVTTHKDIGFFPTPPQLAIELVGMAGVESGHICLEPSAGTGNIVRALIAAGAGKVWAIERDQKMRHHLVKTFPDVCDVSPIDDFMEMGFGGSVFTPEFDRVVMNPPFCKINLNDHLDHARLAYRLLKVGGILVCVLPSSVLFRQDRRHAEFRTWVSEAGGTITDLHPGSFRESGTLVNTCVLFIEKSTA